MQIFIDLSSVERAADREGRERGWRGGKRKTKRERDTQRGGESEG